MLAGFVIVTYGDGVREFTSGQLLSIARDHFDGSLAQTSLVISVSGIVGTVALLAIGPMIDRYGPRRLMLIGIPLAGVGLAGLGLAQGIVGLTIINGIFIALGVSAGFLLPVQTAVANWFNRKRSIALAMVSAASVAGGAIAIFLDQSIAGQFPWRNGFQVLSPATLAFGIPLALVTRHRPEPYGLLPDGGVTGKPEICFTLRQTLKSRAFWLLSGGMALASWVTIASFFRSPLLFDRGSLPV